MYKYKKHKHAYICTHTQTFACISALSHLCTRTPYTINTRALAHARKQTDTRSHSQVYILSDMHAHVDSSIFTCKHKYTHTY